MSGGLTIAILAAGRAERFGGGKLDAEIAGKRLGSYTVEAAAPLGEPKIVAAPPVPQFAGEAMALGLAQILKNKRADDGIGTSVALAAMQASAAGAEALLLLAADMPMVTSATLRRLVEAVAPDSPAACAYPDGSAGIPACFPASWFARLAQLEGDRGAGRLLRQAETLRLIEVPAGELADVDTPEDLKALRARHVL